MQYCSYYTAYINKSLCWYVVAILKSYEHLAFDRTLDTPTNLFEFYVPEDREQEFVWIMNYFEKEKLVSELTKKQNRLMDPDQEL